MSIEVVRIGMEEAEDSGASVRKRLCNRLFFFSEYIWILGEKGCAILSHALFPLLQIKTYGRRHLPSGKTLAPRRPAVSHATPLHTPGTGGRAGGAARGWVAAEPGHGALGAHVFSANLIQMVFFWAF